MSLKSSYTHPVLATAIGVNLLILIAAVAFSGNPAAMAQLLTEDGVIEWLQFLCFTVISAMLFYVGARRWGRGDTSAFELLVLFGLGGLVALAALEEISWFQRILNVASPEYFAKNNRQAETNIHNLALGSASLHKTVLLKLIFLTGITHNLILPLVARWKPGVKHWVESMGLYLPPLKASIAYLVLVALSHLVVEHERKGELGETFGAVHYLATVFGAYFIGMEYGKKPLFGDHETRRGVSALFAMLVAFLLLVSWLLSAGAGAMAAAAR
ncbi:hypothetical protein KY495_06610 [Massilia sp. PAMC28688]|uniref:hypothetical protein n=1 Tax=Massilia sp. PAMC28688 TaxID=2861283 RepID=UPI001C6306F9|nr:hypothetical protein [Massilia sp. PAMC28688]QYF94850.1 hypothetical protein KY495_06610 [Massilia sp. PAMC28688]